MVLFVYGVPYGEYHCLLTKRKNSISFHSVSKILLAKSQENTYCPHTNCLCGYIPSRLWKKSTATYAHLLLLAEFRVFENIIGELASKLAYTG
jgi:hypothetical protein